MLRREAAWRCRAGNPCHGTCFLVVIRLLIAFALSHESGRCLTHDNGFRLANHQGGWNRSSCRPLLLKPCRAGWRTGLAYKKKQGDIRGHGSQRQNERIPLCFRVSTSGGFRARLKAELLDLRGGRGGESSEQTDLRQAPCSRAFIFRNTCQKLSRARSMASCHGSAARAPHTGRLSRRWRCPMKAGEIDPCRPASRRRACGYQDCRNDDPHLAEG